MEAALLVLSCLQSPPVRCLRFTIGRGSAVEHLWVIALFTNFITLEHHCRCR